jgi:hypothetical protein
MEFAHASILAHDGKAWAQARLEAGTTQLFSPLRWSDRVPFGRSIHQKEQGMLRTRLVALLLAGGLLTLNGCCCWPGPFRCGNRPNCCGNSIEAGASPVTDGPILMPQGATVDGNLPLAPIPRPVTPHSQPMPYTP